MPFQWRDLVVVLRCWLRVRYRCQLNWLDKSQTLTDMFTQVWNSGSGKEGEVLFQGAKMPAKDLGKFILKDSYVLASVYWKKSRVVSAGKRWHVAKFWKPNPNNNDTPTYSVVF